MATITLGKTICRRKFAKFRWFLFTQSDATPARINPSCTMRETKHVVAYIRVSTEEQRKKHGIKIQRRSVLECAQAHSLVIHHFYKDEAESGVLEERTELQRLLRDCEAGKIGTIIIPSIDRLSRDVRLAENLFWQFEQLRVRVLIADMPQYNAKNRKDVFLRQIREAIAEENRKDIIEKLWEGRKQRVRDGLLPGGNTAYGYRRNGNGPETDDEESKIVRIIFDRADRGENRSAIARLLNAHSFKRRNGETWTPRQVSAILSRIDFYKKGVIRYGTITGENKIFALVT